MENEKTKLMWYKGKVLKIGDEPHWIELGKMIVNSGRLSAMPSMNMTDFNPNIVVQGPEDVWIIASPDMLPTTCTSVVPATSIPTTLSPVILKDMQ